jgi:hypothetical protein
MGCPGSALRKSLTHATHVDVSEHDGTLEMTLSDIHGHAVAVFRSTDS